MSIKKVVLTGACGRMAGLIIDALRGRYDLVPIDIKTTNNAGKEIEGV